MMLLREICDQDGITVVVNLHQVELAKRFAGRIIGMNSWRCVFEGSPKQRSPVALNEAATGRKTTSPPHELVCTHMSLYQGDNFAIVREGRPA